MSAETPASQRPPVEPPVLPPADYEDLTALGRCRREFAPLAGALTLWSVLDALLKRPARVTHELLLHGRQRLVAGLLAALLLACLAAYGAMMGAFSGGWQIAFASAKVVLGTLACMVICLPSLYIFASLSGGRLTFPETARLLLQAMALAGVLLVGFVPIVWLFAQSTGTLGFMGFLHLVVWVIAIACALGLLHRMIQMASPCEPALLRIWCMIFLLVTLQMSTTLRPLIGRDDGRLIDRTPRFFAAHWMRCTGAGE